MFQELWLQIENADDKKLPRVISAVAAQYDEMMLECPVIPDEGFEFLLQIFSCQRVLKAKGIEHFLLEINVDFVKYNLVQRTQLLEKLIEVCGTVSDELGRHSIGDFIARAYPTELAFQTFVALSERGASERAVAFSGLDVLRMRANKGGNPNKQVEEKWREMLGNSRL
jgi:hypothetical protein